jgi:hypothetical protein
MKHGSRNAYNKGCRCKKCTAATAAQAWARRKVEGWDEPLRVTEEPVVTRDGLMIPSALIAKVIHERQHQIKMNILEEVWKVLFKREF